MTLEELMNAPAPASRWVLERDCAETGLNPEDIRAEMLRRIGEMRSSIERGLRTEAQSITGMVGWNAKGLWDAPDALNAPLLRRVQAYAMAVNEENARMGRIVAAPTAGSAGNRHGVLGGPQMRRGVRPGWGRARTLITGHAEALIFSCRKAAVRWSRPRRRRFFLPENDSRTAWPSDLLGAPCPVTGLGLQPAGYGGVGAATVPRLPRPSLL